MAELEDVSIYQQVGGFKTFQRLVDTFYDQVETDPLLRPLFEEPTLDGPKERLALFLAQFFGGPPNYSLQRGHPMLRARHLKFPIAQPQRDAWVGHMLAAIDATGIAEPARGEMRLYFQRTATFLINRVED